MGDVKEAGPNGHVMEVPDEDPIVMTQFYYFLVFNVIAPDHHTRDKSGRKIVYPGRIRTENTQVMMDAPIHYDLILRLQEDLAEKWGVALEKNQSISMLGDKTRVVVTDFRLMAQRQIRKSEAEAELAAMEQMKKDEETSAGRAAGEQAEEGPVQ